jgi:hypothetical protein
MTMSLARKQNEKSSVSGRVSRFAKTMALGVACLASVLTGCAPTGLDSSDIQFTNAGPAGNLQMALTVSAGDNQYRLTEGILRFDGPQELEIDVAKNFVDQSYLDLILVVGNYTVTLEDGWVVSSNEDGVWVPVKDAQLVSPNPQEAQVLESIKTTVALSFEVMLQDIEFTTGEAVVEIEVNEVACKDGQEKIRSCTVNGILGTSHTECVDSEWNGWSECNIETAVVGGNLISGGEMEEIIVTCLGKYAAFTSQLYLDNNNTFICDSADVGTVVNLGYWPVGEELVFRLDVDNTGYSYYTGAAERNPDNIEHAVVEPQEDGSIFFGFEDLHNGGDMDFDDCNFSVTGTQMALIK